MVAISLISFRLCAQNGVTADQIPPLPGPHNYIQGLSETVTPSNGQVNITIPVPMPKGRGLDIPFSVQWNSNGLYTFIPTVTYVGSGDGQDQSVNPVVTSFAYEQTQRSGISSHSLSSGGWSYTVPQYWATGHTYTPPASNQYGNNPPPVTCSWTTDYTFSDPTGGRHFLGLDWYDTGGCGTNGNVNNPPYQNSLSFNLSGRDAEYWGAYNQSNSRFPYNVVVGDYHGNTYQFNNSNLVTGYVGVGQQGTWITNATQIEDRNGNLISIATNGNAISYTDTVGRPVLAISNFASASDSITVAGQSTPYTIAWSNVSNTNGSSSPSGNFTLRYGTTQSCTTSGGYGGLYQANAVQTISLPDRQKYTFYYDPVYTGYINKIVYPSGAWVKYTWGLNPQSEAGNYLTKTGPNTGSSPSCGLSYDEYAVVQRDVSPTGSASPDQTQTFSYATSWTTNAQGLLWTTKTTTLKTTDNLRGTSTKTVYTYSPIGAPVDANDPAAPLVASRIPLETSIQYDTNLTVTKSWASSKNLLCSVSTETTKSGSLSSGTFYQYQVNGLFPNPTDIRLYDYGAVTPAQCTSYNYNASSTPTLPSASPLIETATVYQPFSAMPTLAELLTFPQMVTVSGLGGNSSVTKYFYDQTATTSISNVIQHDESNYSSTATIASGQLMPRANLTALTRVCLLGSVTCQDATTTRTYDETGQVTSIVDADSNPATTYLYTDSFGPNTGTPPSGTTNAFLTKITYPTVNGITQKNIFTYGYSDGQIRSFTDSNTQTTTYCFFVGGCGGSQSDPWARVTEIDYPGGGQKNFTYNDLGANPNWVQTTKMNGNGISTVVTTTMDGLWRTISSALTAPEGTLTTGTKYDGMSRVWTQTNPYLGNTPPANSTTTYTYDTLGRKVEQSNQDGKPKWWCYNGVASVGQPNCNALLASVSGAWVDAQDESGNDWQQTMNGAKLLSATFEPSGGPSGTSGPPSLETDYTYDALSNLTKVNQLGVSGVEVARLRTFTYDSLSRLSTSLNHEIGTICYGTWSSSGVCQSGYDPNGNLQYKTDAKGVTVHTTYDFLNRPLSKTYTNDPASTASSCYQYDTSSLGSSGGNLIGRLTNAWTQSSACPAPTSPPAFQSRSILTRRSVLAYDPMGRVLSEQQCTMANCATGAPYAPTYDYDLSGNLIHHSNGLATFNFTNCYDSANRLSLVVAVNTPCSAPAYSSSTQLFTSPSYNPAGSLTGVLLGTALGIVRGYDNQLRVTSETDMGNTNSTAGGTATLTLTGNEQVR